VNAKTSQQLGRGIAQILSDITSPSGGLTSAVFSNPNLSATNRYTYLAKFTQGWGGNVQKIEIDPQTAAPVAVIWDAEAALIAQTTPAAPPNDKPWYDNRRIVTMDESGNKVPFLRASLGATQLSTLGPDATSQDQVIEYLRGNRAMEGEDDGQLRVRPSPLGDIVNSQPVIVGAPEWDYQDANDPGYSAFKTAMAGRAKRVYVGANDGMLHAFDDVNGSEAWAFVPPDFYRKAPPVSNDKAGLIGLTYQPGGLPLYAHRMYVDATPRVVDANLGGAWKTLLVTGLGKGGQSYYALDVTDPSAITDESSAASKVLWRFTNADLGYTYGKPTIIKTRAFGWVVIVSSGYNNSTGEGKLFVLDAATGTLLKTLATGAGTPGAPAGLTHFNAYVKDYRNQLAEQIYAGDLLGNVWRFNVQDANDGNWTVEKLARLTDDLGTPQPITIPPMIEVDLSNGVDRWVFVGTGRLLHSDDLSDTQQQRMYALRDGTYDTPSTITAGAPLTVADLDAVSGVTGLGAGVIAEKGWYDDLPAGQRIVRPIAATVGLVAYIATGLPIDPCEVGQPANVYVRQFGNGESRLESGPGVFTETIYVPDGGAGLSIISTVDPTCTSNCIPTLKLAVTTTKPEIKLFGAKLPGFLDQHRISWRQLGLQ
jgi:type IV pilus assembly protein PilY1